MLKPTTGVAVITDNKEQVGIVEREFYMISNFSAHQVAINGVIYPTAEHAYHCQRFKNSEINNEIMKATSPIKAKEISWKYKKTKQIKNWNEIKVSKMKEVCRLKLEQHDDVKEALINTGTRTIFEDIAEDNFWGIGPDGNGQNMLGKIWMELRVELINS